MNAVQTPAAAAEPAPATDRALRIGFDGRYINDRYHGIGRYAFRLLEALAAIAPQHHFVIYRGPLGDTRFDWQALEERDNLEVQAGPWPLYTPLEPLQWLPRLRPARLDLFYSPNFTAPLLGETPVIVTIHDLIFDRHPEYMPQAWARPYYRLTMRLALRRARWVVAVSRATARDLVSLYRLPPSRLAIVRPGVEPGFAPQQDVQAVAALRQRYGLQRPFFLNLGARRPHKNGARLVQAFARLAPELPHDLVFAGPADRRFPDYARQAARKLGLEARVHFLDWVPEADLPELYSLAQAVVLPSLIEGFGLPALEALACGTPVAVSQGTALAEAVGPAGLHFNPRDPDSIAAALRRLACEPDLRAQLQSAGLQRAANLNWPAAARRSLSIIQRALPA